MAALTHKNLSFIMSVIFLISFITTTATLDAPKAGFSVSLTFIDPDNLLQNLTQVLEQTKYRISSRFNPTMIRPPLLGNNLGYYIIISVGSERKVNTLLLDTAGSLTWIQCEPCNPCFNQRDPIFSPSHSSSYKLIQCTDLLCRRPYRCVNNRCIFEYGGMHATISGDLARETFHFGSSVHPVESIPHLGFGCVHTSRNYDNNRGITSGIFSLDSSFSSFAEQLFIDRFSYCLHRPDAYSGRSYLRFGSDVLVHRPVQRTHLLHFPDSSMHFLDLIDLTIANTRLGLPPNTFSRQTNGHGGCAIYTSSPLSAFIQPAWDQIKRFFIAYFERHNVRPVQGPATLCFHLVAGIEKHFVSMTLHFRDGANFHLRPERIWRTFPQQRMFCSTLTYHRQITVIGFMQQIDANLMYDLRRNELSISAPVDCSRE